MGGKISLMETNTWTRVNRVMISQRRPDVDDSIDEDRTCVLFKDNMYFSTTKAAFTRWTYRIHPEDTMRKEMGWGLQAVVGSKEGAVRFYSARDAVQDGKLFHQGVNPWLAREGTLGLKHTCRSRDAHVGEVTGVSSCDDGSISITSSVDSTLMVWSTDRTCDRVATLRGHQGPITCCHIASDGSVAASGGADHRVMIWCLKSKSRVAVLGGRRKDMGEILHSFTSKERQAWLSAPRALLHTKPIECVCLPHKPPFDMVATGSRDHTVILWDVEKGCGVAQFEGHEDFISACRFSPIGGGRHLVISGSYDKTVRMWDARSKASAGVLKGHGAGVTCLDVTTNVEFGQLAVSGAWDGEVKVWDIWKMKERRTLLGHYDAVTQCGLLGDGEYMMTSGIDMKSRLWTTREFKDVRMKVEQMLNAHKVDLFLTVRYDVDDTVAACKDIYNLHSTRKDEKGNFVILDSVFREIPPQKQVWVLNQNKRARKLEDDTKIMDLKLTEHDYIEIIRPLSDEEMALALKRMEAKAIKQAKEAQVAEKRARAKAMGFAISSSGESDTGGGKEGRGAPAVLSAKVSG